MYGDTPGPVLSRLFAVAGEETGKIVGGNPWEIVEGDGPIAAFAIHNGHEVRDEVASRFAVSDETRLMEEDPFTGLFTDIAGTRVVVNMSRFEVDLNRPRERAVYIKRRDAWEIRVWKKKPPVDIVARSLEQYDGFYTMAHKVFSNIEKRYGRFIVLDLHSYNYRRDGEDGPVADEAENPEINIGTGTMERERWAPIVDRFIEDLSGFDFMGRKLDVRENVKFRGGWLPRWIHENFPDTGCAIAVEVKKFFMDEWTGELDRQAFDCVHEALKSTIPGVLEELGKMSS